MNWIVAYRNTLLVVCGSCFVCASSSQVALSQTLSPVSIQADLDRRSITTSENVILTVNLTNTGHFLVMELDIQISSPGFKVISQKEWPDNFYPNSSLIGQYILEPTSSGTFPIFLSSTYILNDTQTRPPTIKQIGSTQELGEVYIQSDPFLSWSSAWEGAPTTILGIIVGFVITKVTDYWTSRRIEERDRKEKTDLAKSYVFNWLEVNQKLVEKNQPPRFDKPWEGIESVYEFIPNTLRNKIRNLYIELNDYSGSGNKNSLSPDLCTKISALQDANGWIT
jgi:hypothetical protein